MRAEPSAPLIRHLGGGLASASGPVSLRQARACAAHLRVRLDDIEAAIAAAVLWRRAAGWSDPDAADTPVRGP